MGWGPAPLLASAEVTHLELPVTDRTVGRTLADGPFLSWQAATGKALLIAERACPLAAIHTRSTQNTAICDGLDFQLSLTSNADASVHCAEAVEG